MLQYMNEPVSQQYERLAPVDEGTAAEKKELTLVQLLRVIVQRETAFAMGCNEESKAPGTLYV